LNTQALEWFNSKKMEIFNVIVRSGMHDTPVSNFKKKLMVVNGS
jgi:hypothetical protein